MGSCISKCKPTRKKNSPKKQEDDEEEDRVNRSVVQLQDKLVIAASESPPLKSPTPPPPAQKPQNPNPFLSPLSPSPSHSSCSSSSFSLSTNCPNSSSSSSSNPSLSSASSCASSISISKHNSSFSNEFLQSRLKENPPIVLLDPNKLAGNCVGVSPPSLPPYHHQHHHHHPVKPKSPAAGPTQKRQRASSPNLTRQKSFRRDPVGPTLTVSANKPSSLRSPSPSRRFVSNAGAQPERNCKRIVANSKRNGGLSRSNTSVVSNSAGGYVKKENLKPFSDPNSRSRRSIRSPSMRKDSAICSLNRVVSRVDGITIGEEKGHLSGLQDVEMLPVEDLNNPLIALDCFIFL